MSDENFDGACKCYVLEPNTQKVLVIQSNDNQNIISFSNAHKKKLEDLILKYGAILFREFDINSVSEFNKLSQVFSENLLEYVYRSTPRTKLGGRIYTASEYPANRHIPLHNEFSYFRKWPSKIMFFCVVAPSSGGETPIADSRRVLRYLDKNIIEEFKKKQVMYVRNYTSGIDLSWQEVFQTESKAEVEAFCYENGIAWQWSDNGPELTTKQVCQATTLHPITGDEVWFNQAHLFHISSLSKHDSESLISELGQNNLTRNSFYGDNSELNDEYLEQIRCAYDLATIKFPWQRGDVLILDNVLMAHGRTPYEGERKIVVAMG